MDERLMAQSTKVKAMDALKVCILILVSQHSLIFYVLLSHINNSINDLTLSAVWPKATNQANFENSRFKLRWFI